MKKAAIVLLILFLVALPAAAKKKQKLPGESEHYAPLVYKSTLGDVTVLVYTGPAQRDEKKDWLPFEVAVGHAKGSPITVSPESFTLIDAEGKGHPAIDWKTIRDESQGQLHSDAEYMRMMKMPIGNIFDGYKPLGANFYPTTGAPGNTRFALELVAFSWFVTPIYFEHVEAIDGLMRIEMKAQGMNAPVVVGFTIKDKLD